MSYMTWISLSLINVWTQIKSQELQQVNILAYIPTRIIQDFSPPQLSSGITGGQLTCIPDKNRAEQHGTKRLAY